jgi:uncharacterized protein
MSEASEGASGTRVDSYSDFCLRPKNEGPDGRTLHGLASLPGAEYLGRRVVPEVQAPPTETSIEAAPPHPNAGEVPEVQAPPAETPTLAVPPRPSAVRPLVAALVTTVVVTALSYLAPLTTKLAPITAKIGLDAGTTVGLAFLAATWWLVLRGDEQMIREHGLSMGGLFEPLPLDRRRMLRDAAIATFWMLLLALIVFPPFWYGFKLFWHAKMPFVWRAPKDPLLQLVAGQLFAIALPEEAFFRGYLQTRLDAAWGKRIRILGAELGPGWIVSAVIFAIGHWLTTPVPSRLAVFFPALLFGWLRARTGGIGAGVLFHALCNLFSGTLSRGYGFGP